MWMIAPFTLNTMLNFIVSLLVAAYLGPAEYGRFVLALSASVVIELLLFDWLRLCATRFYSERDKMERPALRATLDLMFLILATLATLIGLLLLFAPVNLSAQIELAALSIGVAVANAGFDYATALARARFLSKTYGAIVAVKALSSFALTVGGALMFHSAAVALGGAIASSAAAVMIGGRVLLDKNAPLRLAEAPLARMLLAYGFPIVLANVVYQAIPFIDRAVVSHDFGFAEAGRFSLSFEIGSRIVGAIGSALDVILFQLAVFEEKTVGPEAARRRISKNMGVVFAVAAPAVAGCWLIAPSFAALMIPQEFRGSFEHYFTLALPALLAFALTHYMINPAYQLERRLAPMIVAALVAFTTNLVCVVLLPQSSDATSVALAQSIGACAGVAALLAMMFSLDPMWPPAGDIFGAFFAVAAMLAAGAPLRNLAPGAATLGLQIISGAAVYLLVASLLDLCGSRRLIASFLATRGGRGARRPAPGRLGPEDTQSDGFA